MRMESGMAGFPVLRLQFVLLSHRNADLPSPNLQVDFSRICAAVGVKSSKMTSTPTNIAGRFDLGKEQRTERLKWIFYGVSAMALVVGNFFLQEVAEDWVVHACGLTILCYGLVLYVHEFENIRELWLWKGVLASIPVHLAAILCLFWWDAKFPNDAHSGFMFFGMLSAALTVEMLFILPIFEHFRSHPSQRDMIHDELPSRSGGILSRNLRSVRDRLRGKFLPNTAEQHVESREIITIAGEDVLDSAKVGRASHLIWGFCGVSALLLIVCLIEGGIPNGLWLYALELSFFTAFCFGHLFYVEGRDHILQSWVWKVGLVTIPFHIAFLGLIIAINRAAPHLSGNAIVFLFLLWTFGWVETKLMDQIIDDYQP
jgi:hypothetical protein